MRPPLHIGDLVRFSKKDPNSSDVLYRVVNYRTPRDRLSRRRMAHNSGYTTTDGLMLISIQPIGGKRYDRIEVARRRLWKIPEAHQPRLKRKTAAVRLGRW